MEAKEYSIENGVVTPSNPNGTYIYLGDVFKSSTGSVEYINIDGKRLFYFLATRNSVKSYLEAGGAYKVDSFICWTIETVATSGNTFEGIVLKVKCGTKGDIVYHLAGGSNDPNNPTSYKVNAP